MSGNTLIKEGVKMENLEYYKFQLEEARKLVKVDKNFETAYIVQYAENGFEVVSTFYKWFSVEKLLLTGVVDRITIVNKKGEIELSTCI